MLINNTLYLSRSAMETWTECNKLYHYIYHHPDKDGIERGVVPAKPVRALELGTAAHLAIEFLMRRLMLEQLTAEGKKRTGIDNPLPPVDVNMEMFKIITKHLGEQFHRPGVHPDVAWTIKNDAALVYGLCLWFKATVAEEIAREQRIVFVEEEIAHGLPIRSHPHDQTIVFESRPDWGTIDKETGDFILWNLKTSKYSLEEDGRVDRSFTHDLQGLVEAWAVEKRLAGVYKVYEGAPHWIVSNAQLNLPSKVNAIRYVFAVKGKDEGKRGEDGQYNGKYWTHSPLVRGWVESLGERARWAWSDRVEKEENASGWGKLGKNWELFSVIDEPRLGRNLKERVETWVGMLLGAGEEAGVGEDIRPVGVPSQIQIPADKFRPDVDKDGIEEEILNVSRLILGQLRGEIGVTQNRKKCTYPWKCAYYDWCREKKDIQGALESGELAGRVPNHPREGSELVQIMKQRKGAG